MKHIELFAGCGGLSLGLESEGFELTMANELSPMAAETFAYNFFNEDLSTSHNLKTSKTLWLSTNYSRQEMSERLREDPRTTPDYSYRKSEFNGKSQLNGKLIVGGIKELNDALESSPTLMKNLKSVAKDIDLVSGGPPCQSFSMAGLRQVSNERNMLPWEFARFVSMIKPKFAMLENVSGILRAFNIDGEKFYAWFEVAKAFASIGYIPLCIHINAKLVGVPQSRPRFIMIGIRANLFESLRNKFNDSELTLLSNSKKFYDEVNIGNEVKYGTLKYKDIMIDEDFKVFQNTFLHHLTKYHDKPFTVEDAIDDLRTGNSIMSEFMKKLQNELPHKTNFPGIPNHELRNISIHVQRRFRIYQIMNLLSVESKKQLQNILKGQITELSDTAAIEAMKHDYLQHENKYVNFKKKKELEKYLMHHVTKKQTQRALVAQQPAPAALSIPDDACHYHHDEQRTLTVREMARIQSFPDTFVFRSKVTTGGKMRRFEVPQYTQVGNAVPPLLGKSLGKVIKELANKLK